MVQQNFVVFFFVSIYIWGPQFKIWVTRPKVLLCLHQKVQSTINHFSIRIQGLRRVATFDYWGAKIWPSDKDANSSLYQWRGFSFRQIIFILPKSTSFLLLLKGSNYVLVTYIIRFLRVYCSLLLPWSFVLVLMLLGLL